MTTSSVTTQRRRFSLQTLGLVLAALVAAVLLALAVPALQEARATVVCNRLGGEVRESTEAVEPLVRARTVYDCVGPGGRILGSW